ncbi:PucR family transcriptional regulator [Streptomyces antnestii]|uniref:PucR family transcriptional regulator n=1 Tax=Streptomyces antnestii TaxID=2494256 RepID=A0A437PJZ7_9ACTN|nr:PucR family transcriptional regulator [Streptomyces sp. San01]RVU22394.1 PucR family transcriptional regulator [Streptomyces sp. San01]
MTGIGIGSAPTVPFDLSPGLTVSEALALPCLSGARLVAGASGRGRRIRVVNIMEVPDIVRWMRGGELLLTTAYAVRDDAEALSALIPVLAERGLAALAVKVGPYLPALPPVMLAVADELGFPIVELPGAVMFNDILSEVLGTVLNRQALELERSRAIHERLTAVALDGGSYQELMNVLLELSGCAAAVRDEHGWILASAGSPPSDQPPAAERAIETGTGASGSVALWRDERDPAPPAPGPGTSVPVSVPELENHQRMALEHATTVAATIAAQERALASRQQRYRTLLLMELVSRPPRDRAETARRAAAMGWNLRLPRAVVLVEVASTGVGGPADTELALEERLLPLVRAAAGPDAIIWGSQSGLVLLMEPGTSLTGRCQTLHAAVTAAHPDWDVAVAAGTVRADFTDYHHSYEEASQTLTLGRELHGPDFVRGYADLGVYRLLGQLPATELQTLVDDALGPLLAHDAEHEGHLVETLGVYLLEDRNGVTTASRLHVHYNTLRYRLRQIERLTGGLERRPSARLQTELAVHAHRLLSARDRR